MTEIQELRDENSRMKARIQLLEKQSAIQEGQITLLEKLLDEKGQIDLENSQENGRLSVELKYHTKLSSIVFARWILQMFTEHILSELDPELKTNRSMSRIQAAWSTFFEGKSENSKVSKAFGKCDELLSSFTKITQCVEELSSRKLTRHRCKSMREEVQHWVASRSSELYFKFSGCINILIKINWCVDFEVLTMFLKALPNITDADKELITLLHILVTDIMPAELLKETAERVQLFERISS